MAQDYIPAHLKGQQGYTESKSASGSMVQDLNDIQNKRTRFDTSTYKVDNLSYPSDLLGSQTSQKAPGAVNQYGNNYVVFYINVNDSSKLLNDKDKWYGNQVVEDWSPAQQGRLISQNVNKRQAEIGSAGIPLAAGVGAVGVGAITGGSIRGGSKVLGTAAGTAGLNVIGAEVIATQAPNFSRQLKRLKAAIALHTPNNLQAKYTANYEDASTSGFQMAMKGGEDLIRALSQSFKQRNIMNEATSEALQTGSAIGTAMALNSMAGKDSISVITGLAVNPKKEQVFRGVDFRTWQFDYQFFPRSKQEYQNIENIIYMFKLHMHPEFKDANNFLYIYPSEFDIVHYNGTDENLHLPRHTSCVLTDLSVNYTPQSQFTSFEGGAPTQINISMVFKELVQMSKERIQEGY